MGQTCWASGSDPDLVLAETLLCGGAWGWSMEAVWDGPSRSPWPGLWWGVMGCAGDQGVRLCLR